MEALLRELRFRFPFRKYQRLVLNLFEEGLSKGERRFHIVMPPGSGKTILGIEMARRLGRRALVLCPTTAIRRQWLEKLALFIPEGSGLSVDDLAAIDPFEEKPFAVLTYQALSHADSASSLLKSMALEEWARTLVCERGLAEGEARERINRMARDLSLIHI